jgi:hypothetical protein
VLALAQAVLDVAHVRVAFGKEERHPHNAPEAWAFPRAPKMCAQPFDYPGAKTGSYALSTLAA